MTIGQFSIRFPHRLLEQPAKTLSRTMLIIAVLATSAYLSQRPTIMPLVILLGTIGLVALVRKPELGFVGLLVAALCVPVGIGTGTQTSLNAAVLVIPVITIVWVVDMMRRRSFSIVSSPINIPLLAMALSVTLSLIAGNLPLNIFAGRANLQAQIGGWAIFVLSFLLFLLMGNLFRDLRWLKILVGLFLSLGVVAVIGRAIPALDSISSRLFVGTVLSGSLFWTWLAAMAGGQAVFNRSLDLRIRLGLAVMVIVMLGAGWFLWRGWTSGWLPEMVVVATLVSLRSWRAAVALVAVGIFAILLVQPNLLFDLLALKQYSADTRLLALQIILERVVPASPILGLGPANYYFYTPLFPIMGWYVKFNSHNQYVDLIAQTGIVGFVLFGWLMGVIGHLGWRLREKVDEGFARSYVYACIAGLVGTLAAGMLGDWFLPFVYNIGLGGFRASMLGWLFLGGLVAIQQMAQRQSSLADNA